MNQPRSFSVKKWSVLSLMGLMGACALLMNMACNAKAPSSPNFQSPIQTVSALNPTLTLTFTQTFTFTPTITFTPTNTGTPTPFVTEVPWTGFSAPSGVAVLNGANGGVFVADTGHNLVKKFNFNGFLATNWGSGGKGKGAVSFTAPSGVAVDNSGNLYVVGGESKIVKFDHNGNLVPSFTSINFTNAKSIALDGSGNIYVGDQTNDRIVQLTSGGSIGTGLGGTGILTLSPVSPASQAIPYGIAVDYSGNVAAAASDNNVHYYTTNGSVITVIPGYPVSPTAFNFNGWGSVGFDSGNDLYVADTGYHQVEEFPNWGLNLSPANIFNNNGNLNSPAGVAVDANGNIYVTDSVNNNVVVFAP